MRQLFSRVSPVWIVSLMSVGVGMMYAIMNLIHGSTRMDPGAYIFAGLIGITVERSLQNQDRRIQELEQRLRDGEAAGST